MNANFGSKLGMLGALVLVTGVAFAIVLSNGRSQATTPCAGRSDYPFESVPCDLLEKHGTRAELADAASAAKAPVSASQAADVALRRSPGATVFETRLVYLSSPADPAAQSHRQLRWAVSLRLPEGVYISGGAFYLSELRKIRPDGNIKDHPLTADEAAVIGKAVQADIKAQRDKLSDEYHIDYIDPQTGLWAGGEEGAR